MKRARLTFPSWLPVILLFTSCQFCLAQKLLLRNLESIESENIKFDQFDIVVDSQRRISWDDVLSGDLGDQQPHFEELRSQFGVPLFQVRHRMAIGDFKSLEKVSQSFSKRLEQFDTNESNCRTKFLVCLAEYSYHYENGSPEVAAMAFVRASTLLNIFPTLEKEPLPKGLTIGEVKQGFSHSLLPFWFDKPQAIHSLEQSLVFLDQSLSPERTNWPVGILVYVVSLAIEAENKNAAIWLAELKQRVEYNKQGLAPRFSCLS